MSDDQGQSTSVPLAKKIRYQQDQMDGIEKLYLNSKLADVHFTFVSSDSAVTRVPAHKNLLAANSDVFERMFCGELKEEGDVRVVDASVAVFKEFLQFFYRSVVALTLDNVAAVMYLGQKYNVEKCLAACAAILKDGLTNENVCSALALAIRYGQKNLLDACKLRIILETATVFASADFLQCSKDVLVHIVKLELLSCSEVEVFDACMAWIQAETKQNDTLSKAIVELYLGDLYYELRFASMTVEQLCKLSAKYNHVLSSDFEAITNIIVDSDAHPSRFNKRRREAEWNAEAVLKCDQIADKCKGPKTLYLEVNVFKKFSSSQPLLLGQFTCERIRVYGAAYRNIRSTLPVDVEITESTDLDDANAKCILKMKAELQSDETNVALPYPALIRPGYFYTICIGKFPDDHVYYYTELQTEVCLKSDITIKYHNEIVHNKKAVSLITGLFFNRIEC